MRTLCPYIGNIKKVSCPTVFLHGEEDETIPPTHSLTLQGVSPAYTKWLKTYRKMNHNNVFKFVQEIATEILKLYQAPSKAVASAPIDCGLVPGQRFKIQDPESVLASRARSGSYMAWLKGIRDPIANTEGVNPMPDALIEDLTRVDAVTKLTFRRETLKP